MQHSAGNGKLRQAEHVSDASIGRIDAEPNDAAGNISMCGLILAGGRNTRMGGRLKAALPFCGMTALERIARAMAHHCRYLYVAAGADTQLASLRVEDIERRVGVPLIVLVDHFPDIGPLGGIVTALRHECAQVEPCEAVWVSAADMPFVSPAPISLMRSHLHEGTDAVVPYIEGRRQPLQAIYLVESLYRAAEACANHQQRSMAQLLAGLHVTEVADEVWEAAGISKQFVYNVNTPEQYGQALRWMEKQWEEECEETNMLERSGEQHGMDGRHCRGENS